MNAVSTWGDGPDVTLSLEGTEMVLLENPTVKGSGFLHGKIQAGLVDLTIKESRKLAGELLMAAQVTEEFKQIGKDHDEEAKNDRSRKKSKS